MRTARRAAGPIVVALLFAIAAPTATAERGDSNGVEVSAAVHHDVSPPLSGMRPTSPSARKLTERPLRIAGAHAPGGADGALQADPGPSVATTNGLSFAGVGQGDYGFSDWYSPPDTTGAAGATQYVQWVNTYFAVFDKTTGAIAAEFPKPGNAIWSGFGGGCELNNDGDPIVQYDKAASRWVLTQFSVATKPFTQCVAVSTTSDATGSYNRYAFSYGDVQFNDYPKLGVWPDGYYVTYNIFNNGSAWAGPKVCAWDRSAMLAGAAATQQCFQLGTGAGSLLPSDLDGATPPPAGAPNFIAGFTTNALTLRKFHVDWATPANSTLTGPVTVPVASFTTACNGGGTCIPQLNTRQRLDSLGDRLMYRLAYRNRAGVESLVVNHSVSAFAKKHVAVTSVRWYEIRNPSAATPQVYQQGTLAAGDGLSRWMGSIAMDKFGDIALGYSVSSSGAYPSIRYTGRTPANALGTMAAENLVISGGGSQLPNLSRWGDYSAMTIDPLDDCTFWYTSEYLKTSGTWNWSTWITSFRFPGCPGG
jgi:hypothetical protein